MAFQHYGFVAELKANGHPLDFSYFKAQRYSTPEVDPHTGVSVLPAERVSEGVSDFYDDDLCENSFARYATKFYFIYNFYFKKYEVHFGDPHTAKPYFGISNSGYARKYQNIADRVCLLLLKKASYDLNKQENTVLPDDIEDGEIVYIKSCRNAQLLQTYDRHFAQGYEWARITDCDGYITPFEIRVVERLAP
ncbi:hypothetical protein GLGCALEP_02884 [Pseudomonas sp. MM221]|nr:hypothetical protein DBADOPDK_02818 [Pseudomonas sp. MM223]CAI3802024.1 hypothetical protein GLGCALEP_02884 [Pseudomonas sp. MM221]